MIILDANTKSLEIKLSANVVTNQLSVLASYLDITNNSFSPVSFDSNTNNQTVVTIVAAPVASTQREIKLLSVQNKDTANATVLIQYNNNATLRQIIKTTLEPDDTLSYTDKGFSIVDLKGQLKIRAVGNTGLTGNAGSNGTNANTTVGISFVLDGAGNVITTGVKSDILVPFAGTITEATLLGDPSGNLVLDIYKTGWATYPAVLANTITGSSKPTLNSASKANVAMTGWSNTISTGDTIRLVCNSAAVVQRATLTITVVKS